MSKNIPIFDFGSVAEFYVDDLCQIDPTSAVTRLAFASTQREMQSGKLQRVIQVRLIIPNELRPHLARMLLSKVPMTHTPLREDENGDCEIAFH
jgi:hypothetical protein